MARTVQRKPTVPDATVTPQAVSGEACRGCWRTDQLDVVRLQCEHVLCGACLADRARAAMAAPAVLLPLRYCQSLVPVAELAKVLSAPELTFFQRLTAREVEKKQEYVINTATPALTVPCDFCGTKTELATARDAEKLQPCGHIYCLNCRAGLSQAAAPGGPLCCVQDPLPSTTPAAVVVPVPPTTAKTKGKRKQGVVALAELPSDSDANNADLCDACTTGLQGVKTAVYLPCGHVFCRACLKQRCHRAVVNEDEGSIGVPMRCCGQLVPVDSLRTALGKRLLPKYEGLVAKRADAVAAQPAKRKVAATVTAPNAKRQRVQPPLANAEEPPTQCNSCMDDVAASERLRGPCGHVYCVNCLTTMARLSLDDRARVPIRCCGQEFPIEYVQRVLPKTKAAQYERFVAEKDWRQSDLKSDREYARVVKKVRGKQCPTCGIGVQKVQGCHAMQCPHGHHFCWKCVATQCVCGKRQQALYLGA